MYWRLLSEFTILYLALPVLVATLLPPVAMFPVLFIAMLGGIALLHRTDGFYWRDLTFGLRNINWSVTGAFALVATIVPAGVTMLTNPEGLFFLVLHRPALMAIILIFYPLVSVVPQELLFRVLFFRRYRRLLPGPKTGIFLNGVLFSLAHLMYWNPIVLGMTFAGGLVFAWAYEIRGNFTEAVLFHMIAGELIFIMGLGVLFYSGNVSRPF